MPSRTLPYPVFDADNHLYETEEAFTRFLPKQYKNAIQYIEINGRKKLAIRGQISDYIPNPTFEVVARPGAQEEYFKKGNPEGKSYREIVGKPIRSLPGFREPAPRLELMDDFGIDRALMFPTLASLLEERMKDDLELTVAAIHSLNEWILDVWKFNYQDRIYTTPVINLSIVDEAIKELDWVLENGAKVVLIRPAPVPGFHGPRSFALPEFDPFWQKMQDNNVVLGMHSSDSGYTKFNGEWEGSQREMRPFDPRPFNYIGQWRAIEDAVGSMACHGLLSRFPELRITVVENGATWVGPLLDKLHEAYKKMPQAFDGDPVEQVQRMIHVSPFIEDDFHELAGLLGVDRVLYGSDYPHPEGKGDPITHVDELSTFSEEDRAKIMGGNLARLVDA